MNVYTVHRVEKPANPRDAFGVFVSERGRDGLAHERCVTPRPANLYDCYRERDLLIEQDRHGESA